jgi:putative hydrolase of the HAD superfamily
MRAKAILFDLGGTLIDSEEFFDTFQRILKRKGIRRSKHDVEEAMLEAEQQLKNKYRDEVPKDSEYYVRWNLGILHRLDIHERDTELAEEIDKHWFDYMKIRPHEGLLEVLRTLKERGLKLGIVTNGYQSDLDKILPMLRLGNVFDILVAADTIGRKKPDPEIFLHAIMKLRVSASETVFVGDEYENDYLGAKKAGLIPFLLQAKRKRVKRDVPSAINVIHSLPELLSKIDA